ncbi:F-box protein SKIP27-like [Apium graveolens]|uniref:F-box protein SKIP27-like n=1 Tax=Apium graveolens TaxID=4045 RepID=UPI003D791385
MGLGKRCSTRGNERLGCVRFSRCFGRNRVVIWNDMEIDSSYVSPTKMHREGKCGFVDEKSVIESLPQDILIRILCGVEHDDLKMLMQVSKSFRDATEAARQLHFAYTTPKKRLTFRNPLDECGELDRDDKTPNAPNQTRVPKSRFVGNKEEEWWPRKALFVEMETEI